MERFHWPTRQAQLKSSSASTLARPFAIFSMFCFVAISWQKGARTGIALRGIGTLTVSSCDSFRFTASLMEWNDSAWANFMHVLYVSKMHLSNLSSFSNSADGGSGKGSGKRLGRLGLSLGWLGLQSIPLSLRLGWPQQTANTIYFTAALAVAPLGLALGHGLQEQPIVHILILLWHLQAHPACLLAC